MTGVSTTVVVLSTVTSAVVACALLGGYVVRSWSRRRRATVEDNAVEELPTGGAYSFHGAVGEVWHDHVLVGHVRIEVQEWTRTPSTGAVVQPRWEPLVEFLLAWADPAPDAVPYDDGIDRDTSAALAELRSGGFTLRGVRYEVLWLDGAERRAVLDEVFGLPGGDQS
ncbi:MAG: hypothetical protein BGO38_00380 [Cellulomonas sp. 73-145]|uniref:hypothetical protein n=1 Tax=Cellulomonas sp. 73-145 TaxID=1895739 RepID=UPI00092B02DF|nr:hypothetical protein [Cellulomonas sp. 73-145]OJV60053.1 MAG: hypothetical protein BGO38_00380 [Cellulomonas sp. 73-145]